MAHVRERFCFHILKNMAQNNKGFMMVTKSTARWSSLSTFVKKTLNKARIVTNRCKSRDDPTKSKKTSMTAKNVSTAYNLVQKKKSAIKKNKNPQPKGYILAVTPNPCFLQDVRKSAAQILCVIVNVLKRERNSLLENIYHFAEIFRNRSFNCTGSRETIARLAILK